MTTYPVPLPFLLIEPIEVNLFRPGDNNERESEDMGKTVKPNDHIERRIARQNALQLQGKSQLELAAAWDKSPSFVSQLLRGTLRSREYETLFAQLVGIKWATLFAPGRSRRD